jgi:hypothetical protein
MSRKHYLSRLDYVTGLIAGLIISSFWLIVATFPKFFLVNPGNQSDPLRRAELALSTVGWLLLSTIAPLILFIYSRGNHRVIKLLPITALVWPISLVISQLTSYIQSGYFYLEYLTKFPIFIFTDIILPILVMIVWIDLRAKHISTKVDVESYG